MKLNFPRKMRRRDWWLFALLAMVALAWQLPHPLLKVASWRDAVAVELTPLGVLCVTKPSDNDLEFTQYRNNKWKRWSVRVKTDRMQYAVSPDGHMLAVATVERDQPVIHTWRNGKPLGTARIPPTPQLSPYNTVQLAMLNSGEVWVLPYTVRENIDTPLRFPVYLVAGKKLLTGCYQAKTPLPPRGNNDATLAPDGAMLMVQIYNYSSPTILEAVALRKAKHRVVCELRRTMTTQWYNGFNLLPGGRYTLHDNTVYDWMHASTPGWSWPATSDKILEYPMPTTDGRFATLVTTIPNTISALQIQKDTAKLLVYERPGKLRAIGVCRYDVLRQMTSSQRAQSPALSPNGRYVLLADRSSRQKERTGQDYTLYRW